MVGPLSELIELFLQESPFFLKMVAIPVGINKHRLSVDKDPFRERVREKKAIPGVEDFFSGGTEGQRDHRPSRQSGQFNDTHLDAMTGSPRSVRNEGNRRSILLGPEHVLEGGKSFPGRGPRDGLKAKPLKGLSNHLTIPVRGDEETEFHHALKLVSEGYHQKPSMPEGANDSVSFIQKRSQKLRVDHFKPQGEAECFDRPVSQPRCEPGHGFFFQSL
jgi:hypothetical protein